STSTKRSISNVNATLSAEDLSGPWKFDGTLFFNGQKTSVSASTGRAKPDGTMQLHTKISPGSIPAVLETDGKVALDQGALKYSGNIDIRSAAEPAAGEGADKTEKPLLSSVRVAGQFEADHAKIAIPEFRMEQGSASDPYIVNGNALFDYGNNPRFEVRADGRQVMFDAGEDAQEGTAPKPGTLMQRLEAFRHLMTQLPVPTVPGTIDLKLPAIVAGDTTIRSVTIDAAPAAGNWLINEIKAELPGRTQFEAKGTLKVGEDFGFDGQLLVASRQPSGLAAWLTDSVDESIRRLPGAGFSGDVSLHDDLQKVDNLELALGGASLKGSLTRSAKGDSLPLTLLRLEGGALDADAMQAFLSVFGNGGDASANGSPQLRGQDLDVQLKAGPVTHDGLTAETLDTAFRLRDGVFDIDRLIVGNVAGTTITATGKFEPFKAEPAGSLDTTLLSDDLEPFVSVLAQRFPDFPFLRALNEHAAKFPGLLEETQLNVLANTLKGKTGNKEFSLSAAGKSGGMDVTLSGTTVTSPDRQRALELTMNARAGHSENLMALLGLPALPLGLAGEMEANLALKGDEGEGLQTQLSLKVPDGRALVDGSFRKVAGVISGEGRASIKAGDIDAYLATAGYSLPGFGNGMPIDLSSSFQLDKGKLTLPDLSGLVDNSKIGGRLGLTLDKGLPNIQGDMAFARLNLGSAVEFLLGTDATAGDEPHVWPKQAFAAAALFPVAFNLKINADEVDAGRLGQIGKFQANAAMQAGSLRLDNTRGELLGGELNGMFELRNTSGTGLATGQFTLDRAALDALYRPYEGATPLTGRTKISASVNATGASVAEMMGSIAGSGVIAVSDLAIKDINPAALPPILADADAVEGAITGPFIDATIGKHLHAGALNAAATDIAYTMAGGTARTSTFQLQGDGARLDADLRLNFSDMTLASQGRILFDPGKSVVVGADPLVDFTLDGPWENPKLAFNRQPLEQFLTQRALEREQQRVEAFQASLIEKKRLRREAQLYQFRADERVRVAEEARLKAEQAREAAERARAEEKAAQDAAQKAIEQSQPASTPQPGAGAGPQGAIGRQSVDEFLKTLDPNMP
ncbi:MAG: AsmA-like C-terminal region-containing protein, partial [Phyllobacterium sp.]